MYEEEIHFGKLLLKQSETVLTHLTPVSLTFDPVTKINRVPLLPRTDVWTKFMEGRFETVNISIFIPLINLYKPLQSIS